MDAEGEEVNLQGERKIQEKGIRNQVKKLTLMTCLKRS